MLYSCEESINPGTENHIIATCNKQQAHSFECLSLCQIRNAAETDLSEISVKQNLENSSELIPNVDEPRLIVFPAADKFEVLLVICKTGVRVGVVAQSEVASY